MLEDVAVLVCRPWAGLEIIIMGSWLEAHRQLPRLGFENRMHA